YTQLALLITNKNQEPSTQTLHGQLPISIKMSASDSAPKQETSDPPSSHQRDHPPPCINADCTAASCSEHSDSIGTTSSNLGPDQTPSPIPIRTSSWQQTRRRAPQQQR
ncbi:hypothetical protein MJO28_015338, partial [Puccinia striiformis f. sp. tritici]